MASDGSADEAYAKLRLRAAQLRVSIIDVALANAGG
jgi:AmiR/NasT family two-component response regulator